MTEPIILKRPAARVDLAIHYAYISESRPAAALRFLANAEATFAALADASDRSELPDESSQTGWATLLSHQTV